MSCLLVSHDLVHRCRAVFELRRPSSMRKSINFRWLLFSLLGLVFFSQVNSTCTATAGTYYASGVCTIVPVGLCTEDLLIVGCRDPPITSICRVL